MATYGIVIKGGEVFHENFKQQFKEALRLSITVEGPQFRPGGNTPNFDHLMDKTSQIIKSELTMMVAETAQECDAAGPQKLMDELREKTGVEIQ